MKRPLLKKQDYLAVLRIVLVYSFFGGLWIYLSDSVVGFFVKDAAMLTKLAIYKGFFFILITSLMLYALIARRMNEIINSQTLLQKSEARFKQIAENAEEIIWEIDSNALFTYVNPVVETILGYKPDEIINKKHLYDFSPPEKLAPLKEDIETMFLQKGVVKRYVNECLNKEGRIVVLETNASPIINANGDIEGFRGANIDITERKAAEEALKESEERYRTLIETSPDSILMMTLDGKIILANERAAIVHSYASKDEMTGLDARVLVPEKEIDHISANVEKVLAGGRPVYDEFIFKRKSGERFYADLNLSVLHDNQNRPKAVIGVARDITQRKFNELELEKYRLHLEVIVKERTKELEELNRLLQEEILKQKEAEEKVKAALEKEKELNLLKSEFVSTASHEFRTPLATIFSSVELIERYWERADREKFYSHTGRIKKAIQYLTGLMDDVLTISKSEAKKIKFSPKMTDLKSLCAEIVDEAKLLLSSEQKLDAEINLNGNLYSVDEKLIKYILSNLLSNAVKFSNPGGRIYFGAGQVDGKLIFEVKDEGIGIPDEDKERIFEPFDRGSNIGVIRGSGLGMSIVKKSLELHGGVIDFDSTLGKGTIFKVVIPIDNK